MKPTAYDSLAAALREAVARLGGSVSESDYYCSDRAPYRYLTARVPCDDADRASAVAGELARLVWRFGVGLLSVHRPALGGEVQMSVSRDLRPDELRPIDADGHHSWSRPAESTTSLPVVARG